MLWFRRPDKMCAFIKKSEKQYRDFVIKDRQKGWRKISYLNVSSIMVMIGTMLGKNNRKQWEREVVKEDLETISKLSLEGVMEIRIDDFLERSPT